MKCSFCGGLDYGFLITGPNVFICDMCVKLCFLEVSKREAIKELNKTKVENESKVVE